MIKRIICWLFGHRYLTDEKHLTGIKLFTSELYVSKQAFCKRCQRFTSMDCDS